LPNLHKWERGEKQINGERKDQLKINVIWLNLKYTEWSEIPDLI
jgi:hypothetical protein